MPPVSKNAILTPLSDNELNSRTGKAYISAELPTSPSEDICVCVVGVGYVGVSLLDNFSSVVNTIGYDVSKDRIAAIRSQYEKKSKVQLTTDPDQLVRATHFLIAVPTPLHDDRTPDLGYVTAAIQTVVSVARNGSVIVIESTIPVGATRRLLGPFQRRFKCGMSPERIDPGRLSPLPTEIPKLISGLTPQAVQAMNTVYSLVYKNLVAVSTPEVAEMTKLYENCYRMVNIAYVNEISDACRSHGIDAKEVIEAAATKPFGFQPFYPGVGVGGHCIPVNPWYLFHSNSNLPMLRMATELMQDRPLDLAQQFYDACVKEFCRPPKILVIGFGFKRGQISSVRSPVIPFTQSLQQLGCRRLAFYQSAPMDEEPSWMEKLNDVDWNSEYIDECFDAVAICNVMADIDAEIIENLKNTVVWKFV